MDPLVLKTIHIAAALTVFSGLGAVFLGAGGKKSAAMLHGIALLALLLVGFAMLRKPPMDQYWWMAKLGLWVFLGVAPVLVRKRVMPGWLALTLCVVAGGVAAWLGLRKPF